MIFALKIKIHDIPMYFLVNTDYLQVQIYVYMFLEATSHVFIRGYNRLQIS